ncbi:carbohydrate ABC transporter permease [Glaciimonas immobilis]|uniref:Multiple sugar transport system permease protein n=1 Tax=Glaciimonas immobilis TaxID=728004 RepID=A0A840RPQ6_9BURK|nr:sugar ABC transporter permease [Glaciimonas immobilis]KAF3999155.1 sugar ABC transporter permease [Glaciimonas immobilis]MBB5198601.1 multiple sugar transport system permease protein [Glaciimonas immobilis]
MSTPNYNRYKRESLTAYAFAAPALILLSLFLLAPFLLAFGFSFTDQRLIANDQMATEFIGMRNYLRLFDDDSFYAALRNNFLFVVLVAPLQSAFALFLALLVNKHARGIKFFRTIYFMPVATTMAVVAVIWSLMYSPDQGLINHFLAFVSFDLIGPQDWLRNPMLVLPAVMLMSIWQGVGFQMLVFLAGLQAIPVDLYEAAMLDGASRWHQFFYITLPLLRNTTIFVLLTTTIYAFQLFTQVQIIANSGSVAPLDSFRTVVMLMVQEGFRNGKLGYASALSVIFFMIVLLISILQRFLLKEERQVQ